MTPVLGQMTKHSLDRVGETKQDLTEQSSIKTGNLSENQVKKISRWIAVQLAKIINATQGKGVGIDSEGK